MTSVLLETAHRIAVRLAKQAIWDSAECTWMVGRRDPSSRQPITEQVPAGGALYSGASGIALFLLHAYRCTSDRALLRPIHGAIRYALRSVPKTSPSQFGFYAGRVGVAFMLAEAGTLLAESEFLEAATGLLSPMAGHEGQDTGLDVIAGAAGAIPALIAMESRLQPGLCASMAIRLGNRLLEAAHYEPRGWSWPGPVTSVRHLTGFAHGASGIAHGLLELYAATNQSGYRYAALQALRYERQFYDEQFGNWPDFRHSELSEYVFNNRIDELREELRRGFRLTTRTSYMTAWCHGAPGIGLTRLRAFEILSDARLLEEANAAVRTSSVSLRSPTANYSLCHGISGNCETLLYGADVLNDPALRRSVVEHMESASERFEAAGRSWPCGNVGASTDPTLMLGDAGVGYLLLRLHDPEIPRVLCLTPHPAARLHDESGPSSEQLHERYARSFFGRTLDVLVSGAEASAAVTDIECDAVQLRDIINQHIAELEHADQRTQLQATFEAESAALDIALAIVDFTADYIDRLLEPPASLIPTADHLIDLRTGVTLFRTRSSGAAREGDPALPSTFLLWIHRKRVIVRPVQPLAAAIVERLTQPMRVVDLVRQIAALGAAPPADAEGFERVVVEQIEELRRIDVIRVIGIRGVPGASLSPTDP